MSTLRLCRSSDERGSCGSLQTTHGRTYVKPQDHEDWLFLVDYEDRLLLVCSEMSRVPNTWGPHSRATFKVTCTDFTMTIFNMGYRHHWEDFDEVF